MKSVKEGKKISKGLHGAQSYWRTQGAIQGTPQHFPTWRERRLGYLSTNSYQSLFAVCSWGRRQGAVTPWYFHIAHGQCHSATPRKPSGSRRSWPLEVRPAHSEMAKTKGLYAGEPWCPCREQEGSSCSVVFQPLISPEFFLGGAGWGWAMIF